MRGYARDLSRKQSWPAPWLKVVDVRIPSLGERPRENRDHPTWMCRNVPAQLQSGTDREAEACAAIGLAVRTNRHISCYNEHRDASTLEPLDHAVDSGA